MSPVLRVPTPIYAVSKKIDGKTFMFRVNLGMWPLKSIILEKRALFWGFQHIYGVSKEIDGKTFMFRVNLGMWPLKLIILEKRALFWGFQLTFIDGFFRVNQGRPLKSIVLEMEGSKPIYTVSIDLFRVNLGMWPLKLIILEKRALFWGFQYTFMGVSKEIDEKMFIGGKMFMFRVNLGMWPLKLIILEKRALFWGSNTHLCSFQEDRWENIYV